MTVLEALQAADREALVSRWQSAFKSEPPSRTNTGLLRRVLAWHAQCESSGIKPSLSLPVPAAAPSSSSLHLRPGTRLLREWRGATHEVLVVGQGFEYAGQSFKSLSAIARAITGTPWSGPAFFGIKR